jgi:hypothetical protein
MPLRRKAQESMIVVVFLTRLGLWLTLLLGIVALLLRLTLFVIARELVLEIGADTVDGTVELVEHGRHGAFVGA